MTLTLGTEENTKDIRKTYTLSFQGIPCVYNTLAADHCAIKRRFICTTLRLFDSAGADPRNKICLGYCTAIPMPFSASCGLFVPRWIPCGQWVSRPIKQEAHSPRNLESFIPCRNIFQYVDFSKICAAEDERVDQEDYGGNPCTLYVIYNLGLLSTSQWSWQPPIKNFSRSKEDFDCAISFSALLCPWRRRQIPEYVPSSSNKNEILDNEYTVHF